MSERLTKIGNHVVQSDSSWMVDTSAFWFFLYRDAAVEAKVAVEGAGTLFSPCLVGFSTMDVRALGDPGASKLISSDQIESRISAALKVLKIRFKVT